MEVLNEFELQKAYLKLVRDPEVDKLELALNEPNIFSILSIGQMEIRHSNFLGWLLNPKENHGLNDMFLKRFLREIFFDGKIKGLHPIDAERLDYQKVEIRREWRNIDLLIKFTDLIICIENKIWSKDHSAQLSRYKDIILKEYPDLEIKKVFVYLTPYGNASSHEQDTYAFISYQHIIQILDRILSVYKDLIAPQSSFYIKDYIKSIKQDLMGSDITNEMAKDIYRNHKKLMDFIYANRPNVLEEYTEVGKELILAEGYKLGSEQSSYVRFLPASLLDLVPKYSKPNGWSNAEALLFELHFNNTDVYFRLVASPSKDEKFRSMIKEIIVPNIECTPSSWKDWYTIYEFKSKINYKDAKLDRHEVEREIEKVLQHVKPTVDQVEKIMLAHKKELVAVKQEIEK